MSRIAHLLFQAKMLKEIPRSGFNFLGTGQESVADHTFNTTFIAYVMTHLESDIDGYRLICMCLLHDLTEARIGDLNTVHKTYVTPDEDLALDDTVKGLPFGSDMADLINEFNTNLTREAKLAHDADQLALVLDLKAFADTGYRTPEKWLPPVVNRLQTDTGKALAEQILSVEWDDWWFKNYIDRKDKKN